MKHFSIATLTAIMLVFTSCAKDVVDLTGTIKGVVKDTDSGQLISGCNVSISPGGKSVVTGENGQFEFTDLEAGDYMLSFVKAGYKDHSRKVTVTAGKDSDVSISITQQKGELSVSCDKLDFGKVTGTLYFTISNKGKGNLEWKITENGDWLKCDKESGVTLPSESATVVVTVDRTDLEMGQYSENIIISSNVGNAVIAVKMEVSPILFDIEPSELDFGTVENSLKVTLTNATGKNIPYSLSSSNEWLTLSKKSGSVTTKDSFFAVVSREGLGIGNYTGEIWFQVDKVTVSIPVKMGVVGKEKPTVTIEDITSVTDKTATVKATVKSVGSSRITRHGVCWSLTSTNPSMDDNFTSLGDCSVPKAFESTITELTSETKYYVRAYAENSEGIAYSEKTLNFTTTPKPTVPSVSTIAVTEVTTTSAKASGKITSLGHTASITAYGHVWGKKTHPTIESDPHSNHGEVTQPAGFISDITGLSAATTYFIRAYSVNSEGIAYGDDITFTTKDFSAPSVTIGQATDVKSSSFKITGNITSTGGISLSDYGHCWSTSPNPTVSDSKTSFGTRSQEGDFSSDVTGLSDETTYYIRAYATNEKGTSYSSEMTVTTPVAGSDVWDGTIATSFAGGSGTSVDPYRIETGAQLVLMKNHSSQCFVLKNNINLNNRSWPSFDFSGIIDGNGFTISNLKVSKSDNNLGFFATVTGKVKNLNVKGVNIQSETSSNVGGIAGTLRGGGTISNCTVTLTSDSKIRGNSYVGGIVGYFGHEYNSVQMTISGCSVNSQSSNYVILGNVGVGGIAGIIFSPQTMTVKDCHVTVMISGSSRIGGIAGWCERVCKIQNCSFNGKITGDKQIGGICGRSASGSSLYTEISGCRAEIEAVGSGDYIGGIFGYEEKLIKLHGCYADGSINSDDGSAKFLGGIGGFTDSGNQGYEHFQLCYSTVTSPHPKFGGLSGDANSSLGESSYSRLWAKDCACVSPDKDGTLTNCYISCPDITDFLQSCYSEFASYYNFNNIRIWTGTVGGKAASVSCPRLSWE